MGDRDGIRVPNAAQDAVEFSGAIGPFRQIARGFGQDEPEPCDEDHRHAAADIEEPSPTKARQDKRGRDPAQYPADRHAHHAEGDGDAAPADGGEFGDHGAGGAGDAAKAHARQRLERGNLPQCRGKAGKQGRNAEDGDADDERAAPSETVADPTRRQRADGHADKAQREHGPQCRAVDAPFLEQGGRG